MAVAFPSGASGGFRHEALLYASEDEFLAATTDFIHRGLEQEHPTLVALDAAKLDQLRTRLGPPAELIQWVDIAGVGANPARVTSLWQEFAARHPGRASLRGIGEPIWPGRSPAELLEAERHEALLNLAFAQGPRLHLLCPYDLQSLDPAVIDEARRNHPVITQGGIGRRSPDYPGEAAFARPFDAPLSEPGTTPLVDLAIHGMSPLAVYRLILGGAAGCGFGPATSEDAALAVLAANEDFERGGAPASLRVWREAERLICELRASLRLHDPLAGRRPPSAGDDGRGLWLANQICDLVELRSFAARTVARLHVVGR